MAHERYMRFFQILVSKAKENHQKVVISYLAIFIEVKCECKARLSYHLCLECFSQLSFDSATAADFVYTSESNESCEKHSTQR